MISYKPGDVILVPFPFTDFATSKRRPALVISNQHYHRLYNDLIIVAITSQHPYVLAENEYLLSSKDQKSAGLPKLSKIKTGKIISIDKQIVIKKLGKISNTALREIINLVVRNFAFQDTAS